MAQQNLASTLSRVERKALLDGDAAVLPRTVQTQLLSLNRLSLYYRAVGPDPVEVMWKHRIDDIDTDRPFYGLRRMTARLQQEGHAVNRKRIPHDMRDMGIWGLSPGLRTSRPHAKHPIYPYLLKEVIPAYPHHVWGIDITSSRLRQGWLYLVAMIDGYLRYVVTWGLSETLA